MVINCARADEVKTKDLLFNPPLIRVVSCVNSCHTKSVSVKACQLLLCSTESSKPTARDLKFQWYFPQKTGDSTESFLFIKKK